MPAKRAIILDKESPNAAFYRFVLWADVPSGNQAAYANPQAGSAFENATPAELQAIRNGTVTEKVGSYKADTASISTVQTAIEAQWTAWQAEVDAVVPWADYGRHWTGAAWVASPGVPSVGSREVAEGVPSYLALTSSSAFAANKFHFVLYNGASTTTGQSAVVKVRLIAILPSTAAVTGALPSAWTLRRRSALTTAPAGGSVTIASLDTAYALPTQITAHNAPTTAPAGGTTVILNEFVPQADEQKLTTADAPTLAAVFSNWGGQVIYRSADAYPARPLTIRAGETMEILQSGTAGTGNARVLCMFTVG